MRGPTKKIHNNNKRNHNIFFNEKDKAKERSGHLVRPVKKLAIHLAAFLHFREARLMEVLQVALHGTFNQKKLSDHGGSDIDGH